ncbi:hypothetical protein FGO68_gene13865 [Halteria grandinella]|uniref:Uncharacterized protein n=1 Tax=Halteria grandinella TaxID=5974 RepID=A0A8J8NBW0_HALGN|nr:hypothetical protein FGO68_gene13865 [Halteria grandinella]
MLSSTTLNKSTPTVIPDGVLVLEKDNLRFFAAHFVAKLDPINPGKVLRETLHGHNYKEAAKRVCDTFHSKMLIPMRSPALEVRDCFPDPDHVVMRVVGTRETFQFPKRDALLLDLEYTSIEDLASLISSLIYQELQREAVTANIKTIRVSLQEYQGLKCWRCLELGLQKDGSAAKL